MTSDLEMEKRARVTLGVDAYQKQRRTASRQRQIDTKFRFEWHATGEEFDWRWMIHKIAYGARVLFAEGRNEQELHRIIGELREAGHRVDEFKLGVVERPRR